MDDQEAPDSTTVSWGSGLPNTDRRTYVCSGVTRGGTSAVAGAMRKLGVFMGDNLLNNHEDPEMKIDGHFDVVGGAYALHRLKVIGSATKRTRSGAGKTRTPSATYMSSPRT